MSQPQTSISIIIPVYGVTLYVERCLRSVINQTYKGPLECIVIDDCGPDDSMDKVQRLIDDYTGDIEFRIITHEKNKGLSEARNTGIRAAKGEYLYFLDSDDEISIYTMELMAAKVAEHPGVDMVMADYYLPVPYDSNIKYHKGDYIEGLENCKKALLRPGLLPDYAHNKLIRKDFIIDKNLFFEPNLLHEDNLWKWILAKHVESIALLHHSLYIYYMNPSSILTTYNPKKWSDQTIIAKKKTDSIDPICSGEQIRHTLEFILNLDSALRYAYAGKKEYAGQIATLKDLATKLSKSNRKAMDFRSWLSILFFKLELNLPISVDNPLYWPIHRAAKMFASSPKP